MPLKWRIRDRRNAAEINRLSRCCCLSAGEGSQVNGSGSDLLPPLTEKTRLLGDCTMMMPQLLAHQQHPRTTMFLAAAASATWATLAPALLL